MPHVAVEWPGFTNTTVDTTVVDTRTIISCSFRVCIMIEFVNDNTKIKFGYRYHNCDKFIIRKIRVYCRSLIHHS
jgi:hypothetical protein